MMLWIPLIYFAFLRVSSVELEVYVNSSELLELQAEGADFCSPVPIDGNGGPVCIDVGEIDILFPITYLPDIGGLNNPTYNSLVACNVRISAAVGVLTFRLQTTWRDVRQLVLPWVEHWDNITQALVFLQTMTDSVTDLAGGLSHLTVQVVNMFTTLNNLLFALNDTNSEGLIGEWKEWMTESWPKITNSMLTNEARTFNSFIQLGITPTSIGFTVLLGFFSLLLLSFLFRFYPPRSALKRARNWRTVISLILLSYGRPSLILFFLLGISEMFLGLLSIFPSNAFHPVILLTLIGCGGVMMGLMFICCGMWVCWGKVFGKELDLVEKENEKEDRNQFEVTDSIFDLSD